MTTAFHRVLLPSLPSIALILASPSILAGQGLSARPASVALTVVVPPHTSPTAGLIADGSAIVVGRTSTAIDLETMVGLGDRPTSRIDVRLGTAWDGDSARVWVRNHNGTFQQLLRNATVVAVDTPFALSVARSSLQFRVEPTRAVTRPSMAIPVEYRVTIGAGDQIAIWTYPMLIQFDSAR